MRWQLDPFFENDLARQLVAKSERYKSGYWVIKMFVWRFEEYSKLVFLDGDIYFRQSADELFCAPVSAEVLTLTLTLTLTHPTPSLRLHLCPHTRPALLSAPAGVARSPSFRVQRPPDRPCARWQARGLTCVHAARRRGRLR